MSYIWEIPVNTETEIYSVINLVAQLEALRKYVQANPDKLIMGSRGYMVFPDETHELVQDMVCEDLDPQTNMARDYPYYLVKFPEGHEKHILAVKSAVSCLANHLLIDDHGSCNYENHERLEKHGYRVRAGETDSFGWLSGRICCSDFEVYYG